MTTTSKTRPVFKFLGGGLVLLFLVALFSGKKEPETTASSMPTDIVAAPSTPAALAPVKIKPEAIVHFPNSSIACLSREALLVVTTHLVKGENTKAKALFISEKNDDAPCLMLDPKRKFKVLAVEYNNPDLPDLGVMEIVGAKSDSATGAWVFTAGAVEQ